MPLASFTSDANRAKIQGLVGQGKSITFQKAMTRISMPVSPGDRVYHGVGTSLGHAFAIGKEI
jgi:hypothetical protein